MKTSDNIIKKLTAQSVPLAESECKPLLLADGPGWIVAEGGVNDSSDGGLVGGRDVTDHRPSLGEPHFRGRQISVSNSAGVVLLGLFRLTSNSRASAGSSPLAVSQANKAS